MKRFLLVAALLCSLPICLFAENHNREEGTIVRMRMADCVSMHHAFITMSGGAGQPANGELCPEYVLVTDKVVYVIVGKTSDQLVPLAETTRFRFQNNEVLIRVDDAHRESRFHVKAMVLRPEWDRSQQIEQTTAMEAMGTHHHLESTALMDGRQDSDSAGLRNSR